MASAPTAGLTSAGEADAIAWSATGGMPKVIEQRRSSTRLGCQCKAVATLPTVRQVEPILKIYSALAVME